MTSRLNRAHRLGGAFYTFVKVYSPRNMWCCTEYLCCIAGHGPIPRRIILLVFCAFACCAAYPGDCPPNTMARYKMELRGTWEESDINAQLLPKGFPNAWSWSTGIGVSLDSREDPYYNETVKSKLLNFIKKGGLSYTVAELSQPGSGVLDIFLVPSTASTGLDSTTVFFVDSNHSHVSFVSKMNHKPHWMLSLDSVNLCHGGQFRDIYELDLFPSESRPRPGYGNGGGPGGRPGGRPGGGPGEGTGSGVRGGPGGPNIASGGGPGAPPDLTPFGNGYNPSKKSSPGGGNPREPGIKQPTDARNSPGSSGQPYPDIPGRGDPPVRRSPDNSGRIDPQGDSYPGKPYPNRRTYLDGPIIRDPQRGDYPGNIDPNRRFYPDSPGHVDPPRESYPGRNEPQGESYPGKIDPQRETFPNSFGNVDPRRTPYPGRPGGIVPTHILTNEIDHKRPYRGYKPKSATRDPNAPKRRNKKSTTRGPVPVHDPYDRLGPSFPYPRPNSAGTDRNTQPRSPSRYFPPSGGLPPNSRRRGGLGGLLVESSSRVVRALPYNPNPKTRFHHDNTLNRRGTATPYPYYPNQDADIGGPNGDRGGPSIGRGGRNADRGSRTGDRGGYLPLPEALPRLATVKFIRIANYHLAHVPGATNRRKPRMGGMPPLPITVNKHLLTSMYIPYFGMSRPAVVPAFGPPAPYPPAAAGYNHWLTSEAGYRYNPKDIPFQQF